MYVVTPLTAGVVALIGTAVAVVVVVVVAVGGATGSWPPGLMIQRNRIKIKKKSICSWVIRAPGTKLYFCWP